MGRLLTVLAVASLTVLAPSPVAAAMCFEFRLDPASPQPGETVTIDAKTLWGGGGIERFSVRLWAPERSTSLVELAPVAGEQRWRGTVVFDRPGTWAVQAEIAHPANEYPCFYTTVVVGAMPAQSRVPGAALVAAIALIFVGISAFAVFGVRRLFQSGSQAARFRLWS